MDVRLLELFVGVAEEGSIHGGARRLMIAQPAISKGLQRLERQLGTALVHRSHHGIQLTPAGEVLLGEAREILDRIGHAVHAVRETGRGQRHITIGLIAGAVAAGDLTREIVNVYRHEHPGVEVSLKVLSFPEQFDAVASGAVDVALVRPPCHDEELEIRPLFAEPILLCCSNEHALADADHLGVEDVLDNPMVDMVGAPRDWTDFWHLQEFRRGPARTVGDPVATLPDMQLAISLGDIIAPVCASAWRMSLAGPGLRAIPLRDAPLSEVAAACRHDDVRSDAVDFLDTSRRVTQALVGTVPGAVLR